MATETRSGPLDVVQGLDVVLGRAMRYQRYVVISRELLDRARTLAGPIADALEDIAGGQIPGMACVEVRGLTRLRQCLARPAFKNRAGGYNEQYLRS